MARQQCISLIGFSQTDGRHLSDLEFLDCPFILINITSEKIVKNLPWVILYINRKSFRHNAIKIKTGIINLCRVG